MTLEEAMQSPQSRNLNTMRTLLAVAVIVSHAWPLALGAGTQEPLEHFTGRSLGGWAVGAFFFLSGLLITASAERKDIKSFWYARARRILPGLAVALIFTGGLALATGENADLLELIEWFVRSFTLVSIEYRLTDAFANNPFPEVVNGPLWSLFHEVVAYALCAAFVLVGCAHRKRLVVVLLLASSVAAFVHEALPGRLATFAPLFAAFAWGMTAHVFRDRIRLNPMLALAGGALALLLPWSVATGIVAGALVILVLCLPVAPAFDDVSYGMYIYGWPVAQAVVAFSPGVGPEMLAIVSVIATYPLAWMSWTFIEQPNVIWRRVEV